jgi:hypothetical protein
MSTFSMIYVVYRLCGQKEWMKKKRFFILEFDGTLGPQVIESIGDAEFTETEMTSLKACAFPESAKPRGTVPAIFAFSLGNYFCYCMFSSTPDINAPRGHRQSAFVIATRSRFFPLFFRLLHSTLALGHQHPREVLGIIADFIQKWDIEKKIEDGAFLELPMLDGSFLVARPSSQQQLFEFTVNYAVPHSSSPYLMNDNFIGCDLTEVLCVSELREAGKLGHLLTIWEMLMVGNPILVYGATPTVTSLAVFAIASLVVLDRVSYRIIPFISITDPRFADLMEHPTGIVGVSNPIVLRMASSFSCVFTVGFGPENCGLNNIRMGWPVFESTPMGNCDLRNVLTANTNLLTCAVKDGMCEGRRNGHKRFRISSDELEKRILARKVVLARPVKVFVIEFMRSAYFKSFLRGLLPRSQSSGLVDVV